MSSTKKDAIRKATTSKPSSTKTNTKETDRERKKTKKEEIGDVANKTVKTAGNVPKMTKIKQSISTTSIASPNTRTDKTNTTKGTRTTKKNPVTPPSSRVVKTQFFPTKEMYANALKAHGKDKDTNKTDSGVKKPQIKQNLDVKEKHTRVESSFKKYTQLRPKNELKDLKSKSMNIKPHIKVPVENSSPDVSILSENNERPGTATLSRDKVVNADKLLKETNNDECSYDYEDDFDSYESDYEACSSESTLSTTSTGNTNRSENKSETSQQDLLQNTETVNKFKIEDERKLDSGNFDITDFNQKTTTVKEPENNNRSNLTSLSDEGFEENKNSMQFINFAEAQKQCRLQKKNENRRKRGEEILSMIRLDSYSCTLFELPSMPYEKYIKLYGAGNTMQASAQTGEDEENEEIQTDFIEVKNKWTQYPVKFTKIDPSGDYFGTYKREVKGVGGDETNSTDETEETHRLLDFLKRTAKTVLAILEENSNLNGDLVRTKNLPFSDDFIDFNIKCDDFIKDRRVVFVSFATSSSVKILTVHERRKNEGGFGRSVICVWSLSDTNKPKYYLISFGEITCCCFSKTNTSVIFAGMKDGTICVWDTNEAENLHDSVPENENKTIYRTPTYITEISSGHTNKIVSIQAIVDPLNTTSLELGFNLKVSTNLCTLDEDGEIFMWDIVTEGNFKKPLGLAHWGAVTLTKNHKLSLKAMFPELKNLKCTSMLINDLDSNHIFVSTNYGYIVHCLVKGSNANPKKYTNNAKLEVKCLTGCPFSPLYFLGCSGAEISLHSRPTERPLMIMSNKEDCLESQIEFIEWSHSRPCIFYAKDKKNVLHIWNLAESDIYPIYSIPFKEEILYMKLSPVVVNETSFEKKCFMMVAHDKSLHLYVLNEEHGQQSYDNYQLEVRKFLNYVNIL